MSEAIVLVCKTCGGEFILPADELLFPCPACGTPHHRPRATGTALADLRRAHQQRAACDFTNAALNYQRVLNVHPDEAEALWGLALCKYGVEFVEDSRTHERRPTIHFLNRKPITLDPDYLLAIARADADIRPRYQQDAAYIARIQQEVLAAEARADSCDVFLCYKSSIPGNPDENAHTREFEYARDLYVALRDSGYRVFFAHTTLRRVAGANYEAQVFHALQSARVMLVITANPEYLNTPWVHSEWSRYLERFDDREDVRLVPLLYDRCDPYSLPDDFTRRAIQGLSMDALTALDDLRHILDERLHRTPPSAGSAADSAASPETSRALLRINMAIEDSDWPKAESLADALIDIAPDCADAHLARLLARRQVPDLDALSACTEPFEEDVSWKRACRFAGAELMQQLTECRTRRAALMRTQAINELVYVLERHADQRQATALAAQHAMELASRRAAEAEERRRQEEEAARINAMLAAQEAERQRQQAERARLAAQEQQRRIASAAARRAAEEAALRQREEAERARRANAKGMVTFFRGKELFRNSAPLTICRAGAEPRQLLDGDSVCFKVVDDCEFRVYTRGECCFTFISKPDRIVRIEVRWPMFGKPVCTVVSDSPA